LRRRSGNASKAVSSKVWRTCFGRRSTQHPHMVNPLPQVAARQASGALRNCSRNLPSKGSASILSAFQIRGHRCGGEGVLTRYPHTFRIDVSPPRAAGEVSRLLLTHQQGGPPAWTASDATARHREARPGGRAAGEGAWRGRPPHITLRPDCQFFTGESTPVKLADGLIAATAVEHDLTVVTRNVKDFAAFAFPSSTPG